MKVLVKHQYKDQIWFEAEEVKDGRATSQTSRETGNRGEAPQRSEPKADSRRE